MSVRPAAPAAPRLAVVVPIFRHSVLVSEAIESVLEQQAGFGLRLVLVNDGCPHRETEQICRDYALAWPDRITYLRKPNGGLSDARNFGIRHVLENLPSVEAIYMLDADNRLRPQAMARAMAELDDHPEAGWIYPNIDMFGSGEKVDFGGAYSLLLHTQLNICEAGSLIRRSVFEAGVFFDTEFKQGFEDWDFFLCAAEAGFRGRNLEDFGFLYRKRPESMLADSERDGAAIRGVMQAKHRALFQARSRVALEHEECPRYAIYLSDRKEFLLAVDPTADAPRMSQSDFDRLYWRARMSPERYHVPSHLVVTSSAALEALGRGKSLHWVLWKMELMLRRANVAVVTVGSKSGRHGYSESSECDGRQNRAPLLMVEQKTLIDVLDDSDTAWLDSLPSRHCLPKLATLEMDLPNAAEFRRGFEVTAATFEFLSLMHRMRTSPWRQERKRDWDWRQPGIGWRANPHNILRREFSGIAPYPRLADGRRHIGFLLPLVEFGGVEKVALNMARGLKAQGWVPHLFVLAAHSGAIGPDWHDVFETVNFLNDDSFAAWGGGETSYFGTEIPGWANTGQHDRAVALMYWLDVVVNCHGGAVAGIMGQLRRHGVKTVTSLHLNDLSVTGRPVGNTYLSLAYEHAHDVFAPCSRRLGDWCHAMGVPSEKIVPVPNAPGFPVDPGRLKRAQDSRLARTGDSPLRVMYLGRLDRQKGLHRLSALIKASTAAGLQIDWRVIGKLVLADDGGLPLEPELAQRIEPPLTTPEELSAAFDWADAFVLLSSYEGLPLTILEAMRAGVVPLATDVGAVSEVLRDGENGVLLPPEKAVPAGLEALRALSLDRDRFRRLSSQAFSDMQEHDWTAATRALSARLEKEIAK